MTIKRVCSICELVMQEGDASLGVSHGYCRVCYMLMQDLVADDPVTTYSVTNPTGPSLSPEAMLEALAEFQREIGKIPDVRISKLKRWPNGLTLIEVRVGLPDDQDWLNTLLKEGFCLVKAEFPIKLSTLTERRDKCAQAYRLRKVAEISQEIYEELERLVLAQEESPLGFVKP